MSKNTTEKSENIEEKEIQDKEQVNGEETGEKNEVEETEGDENDEENEDSFEDKYNEVNDKFLRLYSEFDNFRRRTAKEKISLIQSGGEDVFKELLPVLDDFERAMVSNAETDDIKVINEGFQLIFNKFKNVLTQKGLEAMDTVGTEFDTDMHEAITNIPAPTEDMKGKVVDEVEKGYKMNGKVIRFAKVVIGN